MAEIIEMVVPEVGESITEVTVASWLVSDGDYVQLDQVLCELESDKATFELTAEKAGAIKILVEADSDVEIGTTLCSIDTSAEAPEGVEAAPVEAKAEAPKEEAAQPAKTAAPVETKTEAATYATGTPSPAAAKIARDNDLDISRVNGTGKGGRITKQDVLQAMQNGAAKIGGIELAQGGERSRATEGKKMSRLRQTIARRLLAAKNDTAMLTTFNEVDMTAILETRKKYKEKFKETHGVGLGFMSFFTKACSIALMEFPQVNGIIDGNQIIYHDYVDMGIAVSTPKGLVVPVIRNAESLSMLEIESEVMRLAGRGRDGKLTPDEMTGGTFTISNGGVFGSMMSTPILNAPQSAILGMHKTEQRPVVVNNEIVIRPMMYLAVSYDHRIIDGKESVTFLVRVKHLLEHPEEMLFGANPVELLLGL